LGPVAGLAADAAGTLAVSDRSEVDLRRVVPGQTTSTRSTALDVQTVPQATLQLVWPDLTFALGYGVGIAAVDILNEQRPADQKRPVVNHNGSLTIGWNDKDLRITLAVGASYGKRSYLGLTPALDLNVRAPAPAAGTPQPPPAPPTQGPVVAYVPLTEKILDVGALRASLAAVYQFDAQWTGNASAYYEVSGGVTTESEFYLPRQRGPGLTVGASYQLDMQNALITTVAASDISVSRTGGEYMTVTANEVWGHRWSEQTNGSVGLGFTSQRYRPFRTYSWGTSTLPNALASISHTIPLEKTSALNFLASSGVGTGYNAVTGSVLYALTAVATAGWTYDTFGTVAAFNYGQSLHLRETDPDTTRSVGMSLTATYTPVPPIDFQAGGRITWQIVPATSGVNAVDYPAQWVLFLGLGLRAPPLLF
jgi:hypothetical protein